MSAAALPNLFPALDRATEAALRESIKRFGVICPVVKDQHGRILDGHHRSRVARDLDIDPPTIVMPINDDDEARAISETLNNDRRHMSIEQRREVVAELRRQGHSMRAIAGALGTSLGAVQRDVERAGVSGDTPAEVVGQDGKRYPARKPDPRPASNVTPLRSPDPVAQSIIDQKRAQGDEAKALEYAERMGVQPDRERLPVADGPQTIDEAAQMLADRGDEAAQRALAARRRSWHIELLAEVSSLTARLGGNLDGLRDAIAHMRPEEREVWQHTPEMQLGVWRQVGEILHAKPTLRRVQ